jgi:hypothetical protein
MQRRLGAIKKPYWVEAMAFAINHYAAQGHKYFRFHDSGDIQGIKHLHRIVKVASLTPSVHHWIPTREYSILKAYLDNGGVIPKNLTIRVSSPLIDLYPVTWVKRGLSISGVHTSEDKAKGYVCPAPKQGNFCGDCRACWKGSVKIVSYHKH